VVFTVFIKIIFGISIAGGYLCPPKN